MHFSLPIFALGLVAGVAAQTDPYAPTLADLVYLKSNVTALDAAIDAFGVPTPPGTLAQALVCYSRAQLRSLGLGI